ncbi:MAG: aminotransferase class IV [Chloroflexi bacterium]|nr:aminotransferase class IV [Chloroflexota bacterium]
MEEIVYFNGKLMPRSQAKISVLDYGFLFGYGLFETLRAYEGKVFRLHDHLDRLGDGTNKIGIRVDIASIGQAVRDTVKANSFADTRLRITVTPGKGTMTPNLDSCRQPTILVLAEEYHPYPPEKYSQGFKAIISSIRRNSLSPVAFLKSTSIMEAMLARQEARRADADETLFLNEKGYLGEGTSSNLFIVDRGVLKTPRIRAGILPGVTRAVVFELANQLGLIAREVSIRPDGLFSADEAFVTNSLIEVMPLVEVDGKLIGSRKPGPVTGRLMQAYAKTVRESLSV